MPHRALYGAMRGTIVCVVLLSVSPATASAWMERITGTIGSMQPVSRTVIIEAPGERDGREVKGAQGMPISFFISGVILGLPLGLLLGYRVLQGWQGRQARQRDIDRLAEHFQALFREIDQGKNQRP